VEVFCILGALGQHCPALFDAKCYQPFHDMHGLGTLKYQLVLKLWNVKAPIKRDNFVSKSINNKPIITYIRKAKNLSLVRLLGASSAAIIVTQFDGNICSFEPDRNRQNTVNIFFYKNRSHQPDLSRTKAILTTLETALKLPAIPLPQFKDTVGDWVFFGDKFTALIIENFTLNESQRLYYLKSSLIDDAASLQLSNDTFQSLVGFQGAV
jgi:Protein of unknown function (DUF1759)